MGISDIMERQMKDMKRKLPFRKVAVFLILALFLTAGISMRAVTVNAATYVKQDRTSVSITSGKTGWQKIGGVDLSNTRAIITIVLPTVNDLPAG